MPDIPPLLTLDEAEAELASVYVDAAWRAGAALPEGTFPAPPAGGDR